MFLIEQLAARTTAYHDTLGILRQTHIESYSEPTIISARGMSSDPNEKAVVIVREGYGAVGLKDAHGLEALAAGAIRWRFARIRPTEIALLDANPLLATLPPV